MSKTAFTTTGLPSAMADILRRLGDNLTTARRRRRLRQEDVAKRVGCTRQTVARMERGDPSVGMGNWLAYVWILQLENEFADLCNPQRDLKGLWLDKESRANLQRVYSKQDNDLDF